MYVCIYVYISSREWPVLAHFGSPSCKTNYSGSTILLRTSYAHLITSLPVCRKLGLPRHAQKGNSLFPIYFLEFRFPEINYDATSAFPKIPRSLAPLSEPSVSRNLFPLSRTLFPQTSAPRACDMLPKVFPKSS